MGACHPDGSWLLFTAQHPIWNSSGYLYHLGISRRSKTKKDGSEPEGTPFSFKENKSTQKADFGSKRPLIATFFQEPSTRTKNSFAIAAKRLKTDYVDLAPQFSSLKKGEDLEQTFITLKYQGVNLIICRSPLEKISSRVKIPNVAYINGGDGKNEHPTQALLDAFSMIDKGLDLSKTTIALIGDILHSRVAHSLMKLIPELGGKVLICGPSDWLPKDDLGPSIECVSSLEEAILKADVLYPLRIQKERHQNTTQNEDYFIKYFKVSLKRSDYIKMIKKRYISCLLKMKQSEINSGADEIKLKYKNQIKFIDSLICITFTK